MLKKRELMPKSTIAKHALEKIKTGKNRQQVCDELLHELKQPNKHIVDVVKFIPTLEARKKMMFLNILLGGMYLLVSTVFLLVVLFWFSTLSMGGNFSIEVPVEILFYLGCAFVVFLLAYQIFNYKGRYYIFSGGIFSLVLIFTIFLFIYEPHKFVIILFLFLFSAIGMVLSFYLSHKLVGIVLKKNEKVLMKNGK